MKITTAYRVFFLLVVLTIAATLVALPDTVPVRFEVMGKKIDLTLTRPLLRFSFFGRPIEKNFVLKEGLDIQGGMQVVLRADMTAIPAASRVDALESAREVIQRRVDLYGVNEPLIQTSQVGEESRIIVELAGVADENQALQLIGTTAQLDFRLQSTSPSAEATQSAVAFLAQFEPTGLTGKQLQRASVQFDPQTGEPSVLLELSPDGTTLFADLTKQHVGQVLAIFLDGAPITLPRIQTPILDGRAQISGNFTVPEAKQLTIQLNAGALPVPIEVIEQRTVEASLGQDSVARSLRAGLIGLLCVILFMILTYGWKGVLADICLICYAIYTVALYKLLGVTLTLPGIAGLILSIGMAVDANILIFERMKEELRSGRSAAQALALGFTRAWHSIKDANVTTLMVCLVLINPLDLNFLNRSGLVKGFGLTLFIGVIMSLFTGMILTRTLMVLFWNPRERKDLP